MKTIQAFFLSLCLVFPSLACSADWLTGYDYRKLVSITDTGSGNQTDYQLKLTLQAGNGTSSGNMVYLDSYLSNTTFTDIRFTESDGTTLLDFWVQEKDTSGSLSDLPKRVILDTDKIGTGTDNVALTVGTGGSWDDAQVLFSYLVQQGGTVYLFYTGYCGATTKIGVASQPASSFDGLFSEAHKSADNPIISTGSGWESDQVRISTVLYDSSDSKFKMWYTGKDSSNNCSIGYAECSGDPTVAANWTKFGGNPVLSQTEAWEIYSGVNYVLSPNVIKRTSGANPYKMLYTGGSVTENAQIGAAESANGTGWTKLNSSNPVIVPSGSHAWRENTVFFPFLTYSNGKYRVYFCGKYIGGGEYSTIGYTESTDLLSWDYFVDNPIITPTRTWESHEVECPSTILVDGIWYAYYCCWFASPSRIGVATIENDATVWVELSSVLDTNATQIYLYYGNTGAANATNGTATFPFFDDFSDDNLTDQWTNNDNFTLVGDNTVKKYAANTNSAHVLVSKDIFTQPVAVECRAKVGSDWSGEYSWNFGIGWNSGWNTTGYMAGHYKDALKDHYRLDQWPWSGVSNATDDSIAADTWYNLTLLVDGTNQYFRVDDVQQATLATSLATNSTNVVLGLARAGASSDYTTYFDWVFVRNYASPEPLWGSWGSEVAAGPASLKSVNGVVVEDIKSINDIAIGSLKSINGIE